jgi:hypothetical protein
LPLDGRAVVDALKIFFAYEKRDLAAAVRFYFDREHESAHAAADVQSYDRGTRRDAGALP